MRRPSWAVGFHEAQNHLLAAVSQAGVALRLASRIQRFNDVLDALHRPADPRRVGEWHLCQDAVPLIRTAQLDLGAVVEGPHRAFRADHLELRPEGR